MLALFGGFGGQEIMVILMILALFGLPVAVVLGIVWLCTRKKAS